jgi:type IV pilus assembly protein PilB
VLLVTEEIEKGTSRSIIRLVDSLIEHAQAVRASDIHIDPTAEVLRVRLRIDGVLEEAHRLPLAIQGEVLSRLKILCGLRTDEHNAAQDGRFRLTLQNGRAVDLRVSIIPVYYGETAVLRLLSEEAEVFTLEKLGFTPGNIEKITRAIAQPYGMILATGPTGSGKTTTLYTLIKLLDAKTTKIITIEDPIEYAMVGINQIQVNARTGLTFATGLRSMLRQDPNTIMVGEIRDSETAGLAVNISLTGHLVFSTLHTNDAATTLPRLLDMKVEPYLIASTVNIAIGQRLLRRLCGYCKQTKVMTTAEATSLRHWDQTGEIHSGSRVYTAVGCAECNQTGYRGRVGIHEVLTLTPDLREAVIRRAAASELRLLAMAAGMVPIMSDGFYKVSQGDTTVEEVLKLRYD